MSSLDSDPETMTTQPTTSDTPRPRWAPLSPTQRRVLGVMVEKAKTTPAIYPMTVNAILVGCNQKNNRDPVTALESNEVEITLNELEALGAASEAPVVSRAVKYRHHAYQWLGVDRAELAVMTELLLRGAQTLGELRVRAARMEPIEDVAALEPIVHALLQRGLMIELTPPGRGQIVSHNLYKEPELAVLKARYAGGAGPAASFADEEAAPHRSPSPAVSVETTDAIAKLSADVAELRGEVTRLSEQVHDLESRLAARPGESA